MSKKILVICSSYRKGGNSDALAESFIRGAIEGGNDVEKVYLADGQISFCRGCLACQKKGATGCVMHDYAAEIVEKIEKAEVIVFATPVYFYGMSGNLKTLLDRTNPLYDGDYKFTDVYLLATAADDADSAVDGTVKGITGWTDCFGRSSLRGVVFAGGVTEKGEIAGHPALSRAYELGKTV